MKKSLYLIFTILSLFGLTASLFLKGSYYNFNSSNVKNNIDYLSSADFRGRIAGSEENEAVTNEIANTFEKYKLQPLGDTFKENFTIMAPIIYMECTLAYLYQNDLDRFKTLKGEFKTTESKINYLKLIADESVS